MQKKDDWIKKKLTISGLRTVMELRGQSCLDLEENTPKKSLVRSRSFGVEIESLEKLTEAVATFAASVGRRLRKYGLNAHNLSVYIASNRFKDRPYFSDSAHIYLPEASASTPSLIEHAKRALEKIYQEGILYKKAGVMAYELVDENVEQKDLFFGEQRDSQKNQELMKTIDRINHHYGSKTLYFAAEGIKERLKDGLYRSERRSKNYTTSWDEIPRIKL